VKRNFELYLWAIETDTVPGPEELVELEEACARRLRQGFPLEAVLRAGRLESQATWEIVLTRVPAGRAAAAASLTMRYLDAINSASERGYVHARDDVGRSRDEATRLFLARLLGATSPTRRRPVARHGCWVSTWTASRWRSWSPRTTSVPPAGASRT